MKQVFKKFQMWMIALVAMFAFGSSAFAEKAKPTQLSLPTNVSVPQGSPQYHPQWMNRAKPSTQRKANSGFGEASETGKDVYAYIPYDYEIWPGTHSFIKFNTGQPYKDNFVKLHDFADDKSDNWVPVIMAQTFVEDELWVVTKRPFDLGYFYMDGIYKLGIKDGQLTPAGGGLNYRFYNSDDPNARVDGKSYDSNAPMIVDMSYDPSTGLLWYVAPELDGGICWDSFSNASAWNIGYFDTKLDKPEAVKFITIPTNFNSVVNEPTEAVTLFGNIVADNGRLYTIANHPYFSGVDEDGYRILVATSSLYCITPEVNTGKYSMTKIKDYDPSEDLQHVPADMYGWSSLEMDRETQKLVFAYQDINTGEPYLAEIDSETGDILRNEIQGGDQISLCGLAMPYNDLPFDVVSELTVEVSGTKDDVVFKFNTEIAPTYDPEAPITLNSETVELILDYDLYVDNVLHFVDQDLADGKYTIVFPAGSLIVNNSSTNTEGITIDFLINNGLVESVVPSDPMVVEVKFNGTPYVYVTLPITTTDFQQWGTDLFGDERDAIPEGLEVLDGEGNPVAIKAAWYQYESNDLAIELVEEPTAAGEYTVNVPAGLVTGLDKALTGTFTVEAKEASHFLSVVLVNDEDEFELTKGDASLKNSTALYVQLGDELAEVEEVKYSLQAYVQNNTGNTWEAVGEPIEGTCAHLDEGMTVANVWYAELEQVYFQGSKYVLTLIAGETTAEYVINGLTAVETPDPSYEELEIDPNWKKFVVDGEYYNTMENDDIILFGSDTDFMEGYNLWNNEPKLNIISKGATIKAVRLHASKRFSGEEISEGTPLDYVSWPEGVTSQGVWTGNEQEVTFGCGDDIWVDKIEVWYIEQPVTTVTFHGTIRDLTIDSRSTTWRTKIGNVQSMDIHVSHAEQVEGVELCFKRDGAVFTLEKNHPIIQLDENGDCTLVFDEPIENPKGCMYAYQFAIRCKDDWGYIIELINPIDPDLETVTLAGEAALCGNEWDEMDEEGVNALTPNEDGSVWTITKKNVGLEVWRDYEYKVVFNHNWNFTSPGYGFGNAYFNVEETGIYNLTFTYNVADDNVTVTYERQPDPMKGDLNGDELVNVGDYTTEIDIILENIQPTSLQRVQADVNKDGRVNVGDVTSIVNIILERDTQTNVDTRAAAAPAFFNLAATLISTENGIRRYALSLDGAAIANFQMDLRLAEGTTLVGKTIGERSNGHYLYGNATADGTERLLAASLMGNNMNGNAGNICYIDVAGEGEIEISDVIVADAAGRTHDVAGLVIGSETGINGIAADKAGSTIYSLDGRRTSRMNAGIYVNEGRKTIVK